MLRHDTNIRLNLERGDTIHFSIDLYFKSAKVLLNIGLFIGWPCVLAHILLSLHDDTELTTPS